MRATELRHGNWRARARPASMSCSRNGSSVCSRLSPSVQAEGSFGSSSNAASEATSGSDVAEEQATGTPLAKASRMGSPKPSLQRGKRKDTGPRVKRRKILVGDRPGHRDAAPEPESFHESRQVSRGSRRTPG